MTKKKRRVLIIAGAVSLAAAFAVAVYAFVGRTSGDTLNTITTGGVSIALNETKDDGSAFQDVSGVLPGQSYEKNVSVTNTGNQTAWVRVKVEKEFLNASGVPFDGDPTAVILEELDTTTDWLDGNDGYYYYREPLEGGFTTSKLFTGVQFDGAKIDSDYAGGQIKVNVSAEAVQYRNNESDNDVTQVQGWPEA